MASPQRIPFAEVLDVLTRILLKTGFPAERAALCARLFAETTRDGVYSHGLNRFPRFMRMVGNGSVDIHASPTLVSAHGVVERWNGNSGPGNLNAYHCMARAMQVARAQGMGCVALAHTSHWMRGGTYGWQAADAGMVGICWTNTLPNLPPWGAVDPRVGNNPLIIAVPRAKGAVVLDMAMSQFSYGSLASYRARGEALPVEGGFDTQGKLTRDPAAIEESQRPLPIGYWKGSGLSLVLDMLAAMLSGGLATYQVSTDPNREVGISQIFLSIDVAHWGAAELDRMADSIIASVQSPNAVRYPGEQVLRIRAENLALGLPVEGSLWDDLQAMLA